MYMASCSILAIRVCGIRCITCVEQLYHTCICYTCISTHVTIVYGYVRVVLVIN